ncbi:hypothetical protein V6N11_077735 [Hibiscus sabdariffa]|uniref:Uncharacterized protein n=1 Tax=Hibiscus sabdariffa TaxID=183260 RepID=A0ABR2TEB3_9ROSI
MKKADSSPREVQQTDTESPVDFVEAVAAQFPEDDQHHASPTPACEEVKVRVNLMVIGQVRDVIQKRKKLNNYCNQLSIQ